MAAQSNSEMIEELYNRIGRTDQAVAKLSAQMEMLIENCKTQYNQNNDFFKLINDNTEKYTKLIAENTSKANKTFSWIVGIFAFFLSITIFSLVYGAVGEKGMKSVRDSVPVPSLPTTKSYYVPWFHDQFRTGVSSVILV